MDLREFSMTIVWIGPRLSTQKTRLNSEKRCQKKCLTALAYFIRVLPSVYCPGFRRKDAFAMRVVAGAGKSVAYAVRLLWWWADADTGA
jgi:hypothetical protein